MTFAMHAGSDEDDPAVAAGRGSGEDDGQQLQRQQKGAEVIHLQQKLMNTSKGADVIHRGKKLFLKIPGNTECTRKFNHFWHRPEIEIHIHLQFYLMVLEIQYNIINNLLLLCKQTTSANVY